MENNNHTTFLNGLATALVAFLNTTYDAYYTLDNIWKILITLFVALSMNFVLGIMATKKLWKENPEKSGQSVLRFEAKELLSNTVSYVCIILLAGFIAHSAFDNKCFSIIPFFGDKTLAEWTTFILVILEGRTLFNDNLKQLGVDVFGRIKEIAINSWDVYKTVKNGKE